MSNKQIDRFGDMYAPFENVDVEMQIDDVLDKEINVIDFQMRDGKFGEFAVILATIGKDNKRITFTTGSLVVLKKVKRVTKEGLLPLIGKIIKVKKYYDII